MRCVVVAAPNEEEGRGQEDDEEERSDVSRGMARGDASGEESWVVVGFSGRRLRSSARYRRSGVEIRFPAFGSGNLGRGWMTKPTLKGSGG